MSNLTIAAVAAIALPALGGLAWWLHGVELRIEQWDEERHRDD